MTTLIDGWSACAVIADQFEAFVLGGRRGAPIGNSNAASMLTASSDGSIGAAGGCNS